MIRIFLLLVLLASQAVAGEATIHPRDMILLKADVPEEEDISKYYHIDDSGSIYLPYLGKVTLGGLTAAEAAHLIDEDYLSKKIFPHPSVAVSIGGPDPSVAEVRVIGPVQHRGKYRMKTPATIEQAFALAGGWSGSGENGIPAKFCRLEHFVDGKTVSTRISIHIDRKTGQIQVLDQTWKDYHLEEGDLIELAEVFS